MKTAINNAQIIYGDGRYLKQGSILFDETGILAVGPDPFDADTVIDGRGKTVSPGFIDCHVHLGMPPYPWTYDEWESQSEFETAILAHKQAVAILRSGVTTVRTVGCAFDVDLALSEMERKGLVKTVRVVGAGRVICITAGHGCETGIECDSVGEVLKAARGQVKKGAKALKMMPTSGVIGIGPSTEPQMTEEQIQAFCSVGRAFNIPTCAHIMNYKAIYQCVEAGLTSVEHGYDLDEAAAKLLIDHGTWYVPTAVVTRNESVYIPEDYAPGAEIKAKATEAQKRVQRAVKTAIATGVKMAVGTDTGCPYTDPDHFSYAEELKIYNDNGMEPIDIFTCATLHGAQLLRIDDKVGTLYVGKAADVILIDGDPLRDITACRNIERTYRGGRLYYRA
jgi:imidazolonepropionase-like amidohydrolase